ncbi:MAG TPA: hypothetical protein VNA21_08740 [Steroidobacteraceae bacterium]|nr:hypothetical protein [Steroidobacteraceae bacterium]
MPFIELPRALEEYFAYAETEPTRKGRRFSITLPFYSGERLDRLQWWYHVSPAQEEMFDGTGLAIFRTRATERFCRHIEQWLANTKQRLHGDDAIPRISLIAKTETSSTLVAISEMTIALSRVKVVNG